MPFNDCQIKRDEGLSMVMPIPDTALNILPSWTNDELGTLAKDFVSRQGE